MPQSIPAGLTREHVLKAMADLDAGIEHPFGTPTGYELVHDDKRYAPKAVVGLACRYSIGRILQPEEFSGGEAPGQANFVLRKLGFTVVRKGEDAAEEEQTGPRELDRERSAAHRRRLFHHARSGTAGQSLQEVRAPQGTGPATPGRSEGSIEFKHQNVSGVLVELGLPYIEGYKPRSNYQWILATEVESFLDQRPGFLQQAGGGTDAQPDAGPQAPSPSQPEEVIEDPPEKIFAPAATAKPWLSRKARKMDFAERDAANRQLGKLGEQFVFELERYRLNLAGRDDLAQKVVWASRDIGDGLGFDIISFDEADDSERMLEVKATGLGKFFPFYVTSNEVRCSEDIPQQYQLFRVFDFGRSPRLYILHGSLRELCQLEPVLYRAVI